MINLENEYFLIRFSETEDLKKVFDGGPWVILGHYLVVQRWQPEFVPSDIHIRRVAVWVRVPGLPIEYYDHQILWRIGNCLGSFVKVDSVMLRKRSMEDEYATERAKFARMCVEVDLRKVLIPSFELNGVVYRVEYEGLHLVCFDCGCYGHRQDSCPLANTTTRPDQRDGGVNVSKEGDKVVPENVEKEERGSLRLRRLGPGCW